MTWSWGGIFYNNTFKYLRTTTGKALKNKKAALTYFQNVEILS